MTELLGLRDITKVYPSVVANDGIDLNIQEAEIHAILGENGAGKSTLMKLIYGVSQPDRGQILWRGKPTVMKSPAQARALGIGMVFQHFSLFESLSVVENISLAVKGSVRSLAKRIETVGERFGLPIAPHTLVHSLSVGERQRVEIIRCILQKPRLLIMDEPTSVLPPQGVLQLFDTLRQLREQGCSILYISHKLEEIRTLCDRATILRAGKVVGTANPAQESNATLARMMIGREIPHSTHAPAKVSKHTALCINSLSHTPEDPFGTTLKSINLSVAPGEILGIAGVSGNGQTELVRLISGEDRLDPRDEGEIRMAEQSVTAKNARQRRALGLAFVPEDRLGRGAIPDLTLRQNGLLTTYDSGHSRLGLIRFAAVNAFAQRCITDNDVRCGGTRAMAGSLSGGNLQKFIVGREMAQRPKLLVLAQPTWGLDVGAAASIRQALIDLRDDGAAILVISEELEELFDISDRLQVMFHGHLSPSLVTRETNAEQIGQWMTGLFLETSTGSGIRLDVDPGASGKSA